MFFCFFFNTPATPELYTSRHPRSLHAALPIASNGRRAAKAFLARLKGRKADRDATFSITAFRRQLTAIQAWGKQAPQNLGAIHQPVMVANGDHDIMEIGRASCRERVCQYV